MGVRSEKILKREFYAMDGFLTLDDLGRIMNYQSFFEDLVFSCISLEKSFISTANIGENHQLGYYGVQKITK